jgi:hypothetical protein
VSDFKERKKKQKRKKDCKSISYIEYIYNTNSIYRVYISNSTPFISYE